MTTTPSTQASGSPTPANGRKEAVPTQEKASNTAGNAKPSSSRSAGQGEKKTTGGK